MNIAGPLASLIFAITVLTVFGGLFAYGVYKARERTRKKPAATKKVLQYFVEYTLPAMANGEAGAFGAGPKMAASEGKPWGLYLISLLAIGGLVTAAVYYFRSGQRLVLQGAWGGSSSTEFPDPPADRTKPARGAPVSLAKLTTPPRKASLFPKASFDSNGNDKIDGDERRNLQENVPLTILVTVDDNGHAQGMKWLLERFDRYGVTGKATYFITGNYAKGRPNNLGSSNVELWWNTFSNEAFIGIHGLRTDPTNREREGWDVSTWKTEDTGVMSELLKLRPPTGWTWNEYPWGSRAPYLWFTDQYFTALEQTSPRVQYDASMIVNGAKLDTVGQPPSPRDLVWPFSLETPIPSPDVILPYAEKLDTRVTIGKHAILEVPVYSWAIVKGTAKIWVPPLDDNLFKEQGCPGDGPNKATVDAFFENLQAQYTGNRAPLHLGLHAQNYMADKKCQRATIEAILSKVIGLQQSGWRLQYESIPRLLEWMGN